MSSLIKPLLLIGFTAKKRWLICQFDITASISPIFHLFRLFDKYLYYRS